MRNVYRLALSFVIWLLSFIGFTALNIPYSIVAAGVPWYFFLWLTSRPEQEQFWNGLHWERLKEPRIQFFLGILGLAHVIPGAIVAETLSNYLPIFILAAVAHLALETYVILNREPPSNKPKPVRISRGTRAPKRYEPNVWNR